MQYISDKDYDPLKHSVGGKAENLFRLKSLGLNVPDFIVIPAEALEELLVLEENTASNQIITSIGNLNFPVDISEMIKAHFPKVSYFAVRSSGLGEDGKDFSFAGQFETFLYVPLNELADKIKKVWISAYSQRVADYRQSNLLPHSSRIGIIVQEMIPAEAAGVAFGINPVNGSRKEKIISSVFGLGEGLVSGELDSDNFVLQEQKIVSQIANKTHKIVIDERQKSGTKTVELNSNERNSPSLSEFQIRQIERLLIICRKEFGKPQDIEFAVHNDQIYLLQARPVTGLNKIADTESAYILWDNSNIIESYPGVTTPLTFSFISKSYESAYKYFSQFMGVSPKTIKENERIFANTLGLINGRVYYNLKTWYHMLAMLPGYSINARFMENMMGVKERFDIPAHYRLSKAGAWWSILKMAIKMYFRYLSLPKKRRQFMRLLKGTISEYKSINYEEKNANELMELYLDFEKRLLSEWKTPLLNDFFAMIWFGLLQKQSQKYKISENSNIHNDLLCGSADIISVEPIHRNIAIADFITSNPNLDKLFRTEDEIKIWNTLENSTEPELLELKSKVDSYIDDFGERCIGELKLEAISYTQDPLRYIKVLKSYVENDISAKSISGDRENEIRSAAEKEMGRALRFSPFRKLMFKRMLRNTRIMVSSRENLRYERTRAFGIVRGIFSHIGKQFYAEGILENPRDVFYLTKEEIFSFIEGTAVTQNIQNLADLRKEEFESYKSMGSPSERFASYGPVYHANDFYKTDKLEEIEGDLKGIGCCPGRVKGKVKVIMDPNEVSSLNGDILVTSSTDPGWVTLFPSASAIIVERGSLLSHSAIVSREMGIPCIVGVSGLLRSLQTGDEIQMDGSTGLIQILKSVNE